MSVRPRTAAAVAAVVLVVLGLTALGTWQVYRYFWKQGVIAERTARTTAAPVDATTLLDSAPGDVEWRHVAATGTWDNAHTMLVANRVRFDTLGVEAVTPLLLAPGGPALLVDRGWMPDQQRATVLQQLAAQTTGSVAGMAVTASDFGGHLLPNGAWSHLDPVAMGKTLPYPVVGWAVLQGRLVQDFEFDNGALPLQQYIGFQNTTPHLEYAATWFGLAAALIAVSIIRLWVVPRREERERRRAAPAPDSSGSG